MEHLLASDTTLPFDTSLLPPFPSMTSATSTASPVSSSSSSSYSSSSFSSDATRISTSHPLHSSSSSLWTAFRGGSLGFPSPWVRKVHEIYLYDQSLLGQQLLEPNFPMHASAKYSELKCGDLSVLFGPTRLMRKETSDGSALSCSSIVDVGMGLGKLVFQLFLQFRTQCQHIYGLEISSERFRYAQEKWKEIAAVHHLVAVEESSDKVRYLDNTTEDPSEVGLVLGSALEMKSGFWAKFDNLILNVQFPPLQTLKLLTWLSSLRPGTRIMSAHKFDESLPTNLVLLEETELETTDPLPQKFWFYIVSFG